MDKKEIKSSKYFEADLPMTEDSCDKLFIDDDPTTDKLVIDDKDENNREPSYENKNDICNTPPVSPVTRKSDVHEGVDVKQDDKYEVCVVPSVVVSANQQAGSPVVQGYCFMHYLNQY